LQPGAEIIRMQMISDFIIFMAAVFIL